jgi:hypothetical protein
VALPVYIFTAIVVAAARAVLGPSGAFPAWSVLILLSSANGCAFYGLFNATYPFSFFLQIQVRTKLHVADCRRLSIEHRTVLLGRCTRCSPPSAWWPTQ